MINSGQFSNFVRMPGFNPYSPTPTPFFKGHPGIFNDHRDSEPQFNISSEGL